MNPDMKGGRDPGIASISISSGSGSEMKKYSRARTFAVCSGEILLIYFFIISSVPVMSGLPPFY
jgi:hypothetical protein